MKTPQQPSPPPPGKGLDLAHEAPQPDAPLTVALEPSLHPLPDAAHAPEHRHPGAVLGGDVRARVEQHVEALGPYLRLPVALQALADAVPAAGGADAALVAPHRLDVLAKEQAVHDAGEAVVVHLPRPRAALAHLGAVLRARLPVGHEPDVGLEVAHVDAAAKVDERHAPRAPPVGAVGAVLRRQRRVVGAAVEAEQAVVHLQVAVQDAAGVQGLDGAEELDGEEHGQLLIHDAGRLGAEEVDDVEEASVRVVREEEEPFVLVQVELVGVRYGGGGAVLGPQTRVGEPHHVELPRGRRELHLERLQGATVADRKRALAHGHDAVFVLVLLVGRRVLDKIDGSERACAKLLADGVLGGNVRELDGDDGAGAACPLRAALGCLRHGFGELSDFVASLVLLIPVIVESGVRTQRRLHVGEDLVPHRLINRVALQLLDDGSFGRRRLRRGRLGLAEEWLGDLYRSHLAQDFPERTAAGLLRGGLLLVDGRLDVVAARSLVLCLPFCKRKRGFGPLRDGCHEGEPVVSHLDRVPKRPCSGLIILRRYRNEHGLCPGRVVVVVVLLLLLLLLFHFLAPFVPRLAVLPGSRPLIVLGAGRFDVARVHQVRDLSVVDVGLRRILAEDRDVFVGGKVGPLAYALHVRSIFVRPVRLVPFLGVIIHVHLTGHHCALRFGCVVTVCLVVVAVIALSFLRVIFFGVGLDGSSTMEGSVSPVTGAASSASGSLSQGTSSQPRFMAQTSSNPSSEPGSSGPYISPIIINIWALGSICEKVVLTVSLKIAILGAVLFFPPAFNVSPAHGLGSITFSFFRSPSEPIESHPLELGPREARGGGAASVSEKMAILALPGLGAAPPTPELGRGAWGSAAAAAAAARAAAKGSTLAARAGRTVGRAGDEGASAASSGWSASLCWNSLNLRIRRWTGLASRSMPSL
ncbi:hypothetical protein CTA1_5995 [Colletotrichum tanaceti]|uniref:Uncharacterized protein n=1 Tax=Colletotrichum tanaceti TaxID=1306861 RepID=A0A4U6XCS6_9PEZI|nr:hypothetical protein CTA1_5995 [Colletotrichum tanaceti]